MNKSKSFQLSTEDYKKILKSAFISIVGAVLAAIAIYIPELQKEVVEDIQSSNLPPYAISLFTAFAAWFFNTVLVFIKDNSKK